MSAAKTINWKLFTILLAAGLLSGLAALPYTLSLYELTAIDLPVPIPIVILATAIQSAILLGLSILIGLHLGAKTGLGAPLIEAVLDKKPAGHRFRCIICVSCLIGAVIGVLIFVLDRYAFGYFIEPVTALQSQPPLWARVLVSFYGGIAEEILMRLFLMTLLVWLFRKIMRTTEGSAHIWVAIIIVSVLFGLGHLPMTARLTEITALVVFRAIALNSIAAVPFGWLYWKKGLDAAMIAHFSTDIVLHVILPSLA